MKISHTYSSHSFTRAHLRASPRPLPGLPGCRRRHHHAHFRSSRWPVRIDHLRWTEIRVRPIHSLTTTVLFFLVIPHTLLPMSLDGKCLEPKCPNPTVPRLGTAGEFHSTYRNYFGSQMESGDE